MAGILVLLAIIGFVAYQYLKGSVIKAFALLISCIAAAVVALAYYEMLAQILIEREMVAPWAHTLSLILLFVIVAALLQTAASQILKNNVELGLLPERIGRVVCGIFLGLVVSGFLLTAFAMAPLPNQYPYSRFEPGSANFDKPSGVLFNADGLVTGWFGAMSRGTFSGKKSFSMLHPDPLNQAYINRFQGPAVTGSGAIQVPGTGGAWPAPDNLKDVEGNTVSAKSGYMLMIIRIGITSQAIIEGPVTFVPMQLRVVCKPKDDDKPALAGKGTAFVPIGYLKSANMIRRVNINEPLGAAYEDLAGGVRYIDFVFELPVDSKPILAAFKRNAVAEIGAVISPENAPPVIPFVRASDCATSLAEVEPLSNAAIYGVELSADARFLNELSLPIAEVKKFEESQTPQSITPAKIENSKITFVRAQLKIADANAAAAQPALAITGREFAEMLRVIPRYKLLSLKCNNPAGGAAIEGSKLPVLVELSGREHHSVGVIAKGEINGEVVYEFDYCAVSGEDSGESSADAVSRLTMDENGAVAKAFPESVWIGQRAQKISEFYVLYIVQIRSNIMITSVRAGDSQTRAKFKKYEGFFIE